MCCSWKSLIINVAAFYGSKLEGGNKNCNLEHTHARDVSIQIQFKLLLKHL